MLALVLQPALRGDPRSGGAFPPPGAGSLNRRRRAGLPLCAARSRRSRERMESSAGLRPREAVGPTCICAAGRGSRPFSARRAVGAAAVRYWDVTSSGQVERGGPGGCGVRQARGSSGRPVAVVPASPSRGLCSGSRFLVPALPTQIPVTSEGPSSNGADPLPKVRQRPEEVPVLSVPPVPPPSPRWQQRQPAAFGARPGGAGALRRQL